MNSKNKRRWKIIQQYIVGWTLAFLFLSFVRGEGTEEMGSVKFELGKSLLVSLLIGPFFGSISGIAQVITEERGYKRISLGRLILLRLIFAFLFLALMIFLAWLVFAENISFADFVFEPGSMAIYFYMFTFDFFMFSLRQVNLFMGGNNLGKLLGGRFYTPREEERIFMFLDLRSSTTYAEQLGHIRYSKMIQDCFNDLGVVIENEAEIYQYVGDEVILTWKLKNGLRKANCLCAYFNFKAQLEKRKDHYQQQYNCQPFFKAGVNSGIVTVTEVGKYKKEIAYHGDTINTAARIQGKCNELKQGILISGNLKDQLKTEAFSFVKLDTMELRGKEQPVPIYSVHQEG